MQGGARRAGPFLQPRAGLGNIWGSFVQFVTQRSSASAENKQGFWILDNTYSGENLLTQAVLSLDLELARKHHTSGIPIEPNYYSVWPLHFLALKKPLDPIGVTLFADWLLVKGDSLWHQDLDGYFPLHYAVMTQNVVMFEYLFKKMKIEKPIQSWIHHANKKGQTLAHLACMSNPYAADNPENRTRIIKILKENGCHFTTSDANGLSALDYAKTACPYLLDESLRKNSLSRLMTEHDVQSAIIQEDVAKIEHCLQLNAPFIFANNVSALLLLAGRKDTPSLAKQLIEGPNNLNVPDIHGIFPIHAAATAAHPGMFCYLLCMHLKKSIDAIGSTEDAKILNNLKDKFGRTIAHAACLFIFKSKSKKTLEARSQIISWLKKAGADLTQKDTFGFSAQDYATRHFPELIPQIISELPLLYTTTTYTPQFDNQGDKEDSTLMTIQHLSLQEKDGKNPRVKTA